MKKVKNTLLDFILKHDCINIPYSNFRGFKLSRDFNFANEQKNRDFLDLFQLKMTKNAEIWLILSKNSRNLRNIDLQNADKSN